MAGWRSSGECLGGLGILRGLRLGQAIFFFTRKKENQLPRCLVSWGGSWGVLTILGANLSSGRGVGLAYCKGGDRQFCAQLRADARNGVQKGGRQFCRQFWGRQFSRQFWVGNSSAILLHKVVFEELPIGNSFLRIADTQNCRPLELPTHPFAHHCAHLRGIARRIDDPHPCGTPRQITCSWAPRWVPQTS